MSGNVRLLPREDVGALAHFAGNVNTRAKGPEAGGEALISAHITAEAIRRSPAFDVIRAEVTHFLRNIEAKVSGLPDVGPSPSPSPSPPSGGGDLATVLFALRDIDIPGPAGQKSVKLGSIEGASENTADAAVLMIGALERAYAGATQTCLDELANVSKSVDNLQNDLAVMKRERDAAQASVADARAEIEKLQRSGDPVTAADAAGDAAANLEDAAKALGAADDAASSAENEAGDIEKGVDDAAAAATAATVPAEDVSNTKSKKKWVVRLAASLERSGENDAVFIADDLGTFFDGDTPVGVNPTGIKTDKYTFEDTTFKRIDALAKLQRYAVRRAQNYKEVKQVADTDSTFAAARQSARALRALHAAISAYTGKTGRDAPKYMAPGGAVSKIISGLIGAEYRIQYAIVNDEALREMDQTMQDALTWAESTPKFGGRPFQDAATKAYSQDWDDMVPKE